MIVPETLTREYYFEILQKLIKETCRFENQEIKIDVQREYSSGFIRSSRSHANLLWNLSINGKLLDYRIEISHRDCVEFHYSTTSHKNKYPVHYIAYYGDKEATKILNKDFFDFDVRFKPIFDLTREINAKGNMTQTITNDKQSITNNEQSITELRAGPYPEFTNEQYTTLQSEELLRIIDAMNLQNKNLIEELETIKNPKSKTSAEIEQEIIKLRKLATITKEKELIEKYLTPLAMSKDFPCDENHFNIQAGNIVLQSLNENNVIVFINKNNKKKRIEKNSIGIGISIYTLTELFKKDDYSGNSINECFQAGSDFYILKK